MFNGILNKYEQHYSDKNSGLKFLSLAFMVQSYNGITEYIFQYHNKKSFFMRLSKRQMFSIQ